ncbi:MAG TPA: MFS transporter [Acidobacteriaceae bacterium]
MSLSMSGRLDRLPIVSFHRRIMLVLALAFFLEFGDINTFSFVAPAVMQAWGLSVTTIGLVVSATFIGMFLGATTGGWLGDRVGRKRALILTTAWFSGCSLLNSLVWSSAGLIVTRLLTGMGLSAMTVLGLTYISEMFPARRRGAFQGWILAIGLLGIPVTAYVARFLIPLTPWGWRLVFVWGSLGLLFPIFAEQTLEESPRWYVSRGRYEEADEVLKRIEDSARAELGELPPLEERVAGEAPSGDKLSLLQEPYFSRTFILLCAWICQTLGFYGFMAWVPTLLVTQGFSLVNSLVWSSAMQLGAVPGAVLGALLADRYERKWSICVVAVAIAVCGLIYGMAHKTVLIVVFGFLVAMLIQTIAPLLYVYTAECYPTPLRTSGAGLTYGAGRLANTVGPLGVAFLLNHYGYGSVFVYIAACWIMVALIVGLFGPYTRGRLLN